LELRLGFESGNDFAQALAFEGELALEEAFVGMEAGPGLEPRLVLGVLGLEPAPRLVRGLASLLLEAMVVAVRQLLQAHPQAWHPAW
jgi:hypothetical protein